MAHQTKQSRITAARIQRAVTGFQIPLTQIVLLNNRLEKAIAEGASDERLIEITHQLVTRTVPHAAS